MSSHEGKKVLYATADYDSKKHLFCDMSYGEKKVNHLATIIF